MKNVITTHILDTALGLPAANVPVTLLKLVDDNWQEMAFANTDNDGRIMNWAISDDVLGYGTYKLNFNIAAYQGVDAFYPFAEICFQRSDDRHHHIPLLLTPYSYSTYRGS